MKRFGRIQNDPIFSNCTRKRHQLLFFRLQHNSYSGHFLRLFCSKVHFYDCFQKKYPTRAQVCRTVLIRSALETPDLGTLNDGSNVEVRPLETDVVTFEVGGASNNPEFHGEMFVKYFKTHQFGSKLFEFEVWPTVGCTRVSTFQRCLIRHRPTHLRGIGTLFRKWEQNVSPKRESTELMHDLYHN